MRKGTAARILGLVPLFGAMLESKDEFDAYVPPRPRTRLGGPSQRAGSGPQNYRAVQRAKTKRKNKKMRPMGC